jgi:hypothetical protein
MGVDAGGCGRLFRLDGVASTCRWIALPADFPPPASHVADHENLLQRSFLASRLGGGGEL